MASQINFNQLNQIENIYATVDGRPLKEGDQVFVRVLERLSGDNYLVSMAGKRVNLKSQQVLEKGETFRARLSFEKGFIALTKIKDASFSKAILDTPGGPDGAFLENLFSAGLSHDTFTLNMLGFFLQSGLKVDFSLMKEALRLAKKFPGKEKMAGEIAALLLEKGINASESEIELLLKELSVEEDGENSESGARENLQKENASLENFLSFLYGRESEKSFEEKKAGLLTFVNQVKNGRYHWCFLPFEWQKSANEGPFKGIIRILLDTSLNKCEKIEISLKTSLKKYDFVLYYKEGKVKEIRFCTLPALLSSQILHEEKEIGELLSSGMNSADSVPVTYSTSALIEGLCALEEKLPSVNLKA